MQRGWSDLAGRVLLRLAAALHRGVASKTAWGQWQDRRDRAIRAAYRRGVQVEELAVGLALTPGWIRQVLNGDKPAEPPGVGEVA